jgi:hypothetical protein
LTGIGPAHFGASLVDGEHPFDTSPCGISLSFPGEDFGLEAAVEVLAAERADFALDHVEPAGVLGDILELQPIQDAACFASWERLVERVPAECVDSELVHVI